MPVLGYDAWGSGPALVLVHGFPLDRAMWDAVLEPLAHMSRVIAVDLRGRGKSHVEDGAAWTIDDLASDVAATIDALGGGYADVVGHSMGGYVLFALLRRHREKVRTALLMSTRATADDDSGRKVREAVAKAARRLGTGALFESHVDRVLAPRASPEVRAKLRAMFERTPGETCARDALAIRDRPDSTRDLGGLGLPVCIIHGAADVLMPIEGARAMAAAIPGARFVAIDGVGHVPPMERPAETAAAMLTFLGR